MLRLMTTVKIAGGKGIEAVQWATEFVEFAKKYDGMPPIEVCTSLIGEGGLMVFFADYTDFSHYDKVVKEVSQGTEYTEKIQNASDLFIAGSDNITMLRSIFT